MSISYHAVPRKERSLVFDLCAGKGSDTPIDERAVRAAIRELGLSGRENGTLQWQAHGDHVFVDVSSHHVDVTLNAGSSERQIEVLTSVLYALVRNGLHVYDPQQDDWFTG